MGCVCIDHSFTRKGWWPCAFANKVDGAVITVPVVVNWNNIRFPTPDIQLARVDGISSVPYDARRCILNDRPPIHIFVCQICDTTTNEIIRALKDQNYKVLLLACSFCVYYDH